MDENTPRHLAPGGRERAKENVLDLPSPHSIHSMSCLEALCPFWSNAVSSCYTQSKRKWIWRRPFSRINVLTASGYVLFRSLTNTDTEIPRLTGDCSTIHHVLDQEWEREQSRNPSSGTPRRLKYSAASNMFQPDFQPRPDIFKCSLCLFVKIVSR